MCVEVVSMSVTMLTWGCVSSSQVWSQFSNEVLRVYPRDTMKNTFSTRQGSQHCYLRIHTAALAKDTHTVFKQKQLVMFFSTMFYLIKENHNSWTCINSSAVKATLNCKRELLGVEHWCPLVLALFAPLAVTPPLLALAPKVGPAVHAGNVENGNAFQGDAAEVQSNAVTLLERRKKK